MPCWKANRSSGTGGSRADSRGKTVAEVARDLDLTASALVERARADSGKGKPGVLARDEREELARLRKENRVLKEEREILKSDLPRRVSCFTRNSRGNVVAPWKSDRQLFWTRTTSRVTLSRAARRGSTDAQRHDRAAIRRSKRSLRTSSGSAVAA